MKRILDKTSKRRGFDGWAVQITGSTKPLQWTFSTTRQEVREIVESRQLDPLPAHRIVKVKVNLEVVS